MTIEISHETETRLADEARRRGVSVDTLVKHFIDERAPLTHPAAARPGLAPGQHRGLASSRHLRRCPLNRVSLTQTFSSTRLTPTLRITRRHEPCSKRHAMALQRS